MFGIFANMFRTASRLDRWDAPPHWKLDQHRQTLEQQQRETTAWRQRAMRDTGIL